MQQRDAVSGTSVLSNRIILFKLIGLQVNNAVICLSCALHVKNLLLAVIIAIDTTLYQKTFEVLWLFTKVFSVKFGGMASFGSTSEQSVLL